MKNILDKIAEWIDKNAVRILVVILLLALLFFVAFVVLSIIILS